MHGEYGNAQVNDVDIEIRNKLCHCPAAAGVHLPQFAGLPDNPRFIEDIADVCEEFRTGVRRGGLSAGASVFCNNCTIVQIGGVSLLHRLRIGRIESRVYVCRQALGIMQALQLVYTRRTAQVQNKIFQVVGMQARIAG